MWLKYRKKKYSIQVSYYWNKTKKCVLVNVKKVGLLILRSFSLSLFYLFVQLYGGVVSSKVLTSINRLCVYYLKWAGHTISVKEFVTPPAVSARRRNELDALIKVGYVFPINIRFCYLLYLRMVWWKDIYIYIYALII